MMTARPELLADHRMLRAARALAKMLAPAENSIDASIVANAQLLAAIAQARLDAAAAADVGHAALMSVMAGVTALGAARDHIVRSHQQLADTRDHVGLDEVGVGCTIGKAEPRVMPQPA